LKALADRCDEAGRDSSTLETTAYLRIIFSEDIKADQIPNVRGFLVVGNPDSVAEQIKTKVLDIGVDGVIISLARHGYTPGVITTAAEALRPLLGM
jgi:alkanesulfonate monooxygenase SsuD/methylene tetrahydromethanopterin reductase-like flavin-dependent oxidoreductase (luciferase family)